MPTGTPAGAPDFILGVLNLLRAALTWLLWIIPAAAGVAIAYHALMKQMEEGDHSAAAQHNKAIKNILIAGAIGVSAAGIVAVILGFFLPQQI
jgi:hypothetical protein